MIKLILTDMDGTLLDGNGDLPPDFDEVADRLRAKGVKFAPASGRQYYSLRKSFEKYGNDFIFIAENGAIAFYQDKEIFSFPIDKNVTVEILNNAVDSSTYRVFCGKHHAFILRPQDDEVLRKEVQKYFSFYKVVDSFEEADDTPIKISFFDPEGKAEEKILPKVIGYAEDYEVILSSACWVDIMAKNVSKGNALRKAREIFGIEKEECAAFGDYNNDIELLNESGYSYAMENACDNLRKVAKFIAPKNTDYGVTKTIKQLLDEGFMG